MPFVESGGNASAKDLRTKGSDPRNSEPLFAEKSETRRFSDLVKLVQDVLGVGTNRQFG